MVFKSKNKIAQKIPVSFGNRDFFVVSNNFKQKRKL